MFSKIRSQIVPDVGIDLGAMNTRVFVTGKGVALEVPTVASIQPDSKRVLAVGEEAKDMLGRTPRKYRGRAPSGGRRDCGQ